jgi:hypothetical protein
MSQLATVRINGVPGQVESLGLEQVPKWLTPRGLGRCRLNIFADLREQIQLVLPDRVLRLRIAQKKGSHSKAERASRRQLPDAIRFPRAQKPCRGQ